MNVKMKAVAAAIPFNQGIHRGVVEGNRTPAWVLFISCKLLAVYVNLSP